MELVIGSRNYLQACNWVQSTSLSHCSQDTVMMSRHPTQLWHVFMGALLTNFQLLPPPLYQEYPFFPASGSSAAPTQEIYVREETLRTPRKSQIQRRVPVQYWTVLLRTRQDELRDQHPLAASFTKERVKPASRTGFLFSGSKPLCWLTHLIKKL